MSDRGRNEAPRRSSRVWLGLGLGAVGILATALMLFLLSSPPSAAFSMFIYAHDAAGEPIAVPVVSSNHPMHNMRGPVLSRWDERWSVALADLSDEPGTWPPTPAPGGVPFGVEASSSRGWSIEVAPWFESSDRLVVPMRIEHEGRTATDALWLEVGDPGTLLRAKRIEIRPILYRVDIVEFGVHFYFE